MRAELLHVVTTVNNPMRWQSRITHAKRFIEHMLDSGVLLTVVETATGERPFDLDQIPNIRHVATRSNTISWSKESALNVGFRSLPADAKYVAWIDADVEFRSRDWAAETVHALQVKPVVQPWSEALDLGPKGETMMVKNRHVATSFGSIWAAGGNVLDWWKDLEAYSYPHSGYAWASTMDFLNRVGLLLDFSGLGAADHQMSLGMIGHIERAVEAKCSDAYKDAIRAWGRRAFDVCQGHVGCVPGRIEHFWHGEKARRLYVERWQVLIKHKFDPHTDVHRNRWGILELSGNKPELTRDVERYFAQRDEDATTRAD